MAVRPDAVPSDFSVIHRKAPSPGVEPDLRPSQSRVHPPHSEDNHIKQAPHRGVEPRLAASKAAVLPAHSQGMSRKYPDLESNQDLDLRRVQCDPLHYRDRLKGRRLDSHQHDPVYKTGTFLSRVTSAKSIGARSRTLCGCFGDSLLTQEHIGKDPSATAAHRGGAPREGLNLLFQFHVPVRFADETRPTVDPHVAGRHYRTIRKQIAKLTGEIAELAELD